VSARTNYALVGVFVLLFGTALIGVVLWLSSGAPGRAYDEYVVYMAESVAGLSRDSAVKYYGVDVGRVHDIALGPTETQRVKLTLQIDGGTPIRQDTVATLETQGLTGLAYINLTEGRGSSPPLGKVPGEEHPVIRSRPSIWGRLDRSLADLVDNLIDASNRVKILLSDKNQRLITETLAGVNALSVAVASRSEALAVTIDEAADTMGHLRETGEKLPALVVRLESAAAALEDMARELGAAGVAVRRTVESGGQDVRRLTREALPEVVSLVHELQLAAENLRRFSEELERDPSVLLYGAARSQPGPGE
jgi:phospholipid/cholesterol/gamma-HCH transport system substrate-binding protein